MTCRCGGVQRQMTVKKNKNKNKKNLPSRWSPSVNTWVSLWMCWRAGVDDSKKKEWEREKRKEKKTY